MKLSVLMPLYNVEGTFARAIDSVLAQEVDFDYEIILVNDASTDSSLSLIKNYAEKYENIKILDHAENKGNAQSFYDALTVAQGDYFCVLDGDDYYTVTNKFKQQVSFLDNDQAFEYVAVTHHFVYDFGDGTINIPDRSAVTEGTFLTWLNGTFGYYHTSTYMFRNIFKGKPFEYFQDSINRGDTPRTLFHLSYSGGKIRVLDFFGSAYFFCYEGIWSSMSSQEQLEYQIRYNEYRKDMATCDFERRIVDQKVKWYKSRISRSDYLSTQMERISIEAALGHVQDYARLFAFGASDFTFKGLYCSLYLDSLCATLGHVYRVYHPDVIQCSVDDNAIALVNGVLSPRGGGVFAELLELADVFAEKKVYLFVTNMDEISEKALALIEAHKNVTVVFPPKDCSSKLDYFSRALADIAPSKAFYYASHHDVIAPAIMQKGICENRCMLSFDHGFVCGLRNPNIDTVIAKRPVDYHMLKRTADMNVVYVPAWSDIDRARIPDYMPFNGHTALVTASGAARFYKIDGRAPYRYVDMVLDLLNATGGKHIHYGPLPDEIINDIRLALRNRNLSEDSFVNVKWSECLPEDMINRRVDVFVEPFPVVSYKMTLEVLACGIPVFVFDGDRRLEITDFIYPERLSWRHPEDFAGVLKELTAEDLKKHSNMSRRYFCENHTRSVVAPLLRSGESLKTPIDVNVTDGVLRDIMDYLVLFSTGGKSAISISIMNGFVEEDKPTSRQGDLEAELRKEYDRKREDLYRSHSYRVGRVVTWPMRKIRKLVRKHKA